MLNEIKKALSTIEYTEDFTEFLSSIGIDEDHDDYDSLLSEFMFGGRDPNQVAEEIHQKVNLITDFGEPKNDYRPGPDFETDLWGLF